MPYFAAMMSRKNGACRVRFGRRSVAIRMILALACAASAEPGRAAGAARQPSTARIIDAGPVADLGAPGLRLAGIAITLDPKFITYWRTPGDAGVPPMFDFAGSKNVKAARIEYPAPRKFDEAGAEAFGYSDGVIFPVLITPQDPARPIALDVAFDYAVCANICIPAKAQLHAALGGPASSEAGQVRDALAAVPRPREVGGTEPVRIDRVTPAGNGGFTVEATTPDPGAMLFAEAPEGWFFRASAGSPKPGGRVDFILTLLDKPATALPAAPMRLTLVTSAGSIEVPVRLDAKPATP